MKISVFGLGYVGAVTSACFAKLGHSVIGVDVIKPKIDAINSGKASIQEKELDILIKAAVKGNHLSATNNIEKAVSESDISFVCVGTPPKKNGDLDIDALKRVCSDIGKALRKKDYHIIVIRSTMFPGSLNILKNIIEKSSGKKLGKGFDIAVNPEFLREGSAVKDFFNPSFIVIGSESKEVAKKVMSCYNGVEGKYFVVKENVAQMIKYANNSFHALKVAFTNEISAICKKQGIDARKLMGLFCSDNQLNISSYYMKPGFAYGGSCLPKDLAALKNNAHKLKIKVPVLDSIAKSNLEQINRAIKLAESKKRKNVGVIGLTFKADTDDIRGNPVLLVINRLMAKGYKIKIYDGAITKSNLQAISHSYRKEVYDLINRENLKEKVQDISKLFSSKEAALKQDIIILSNRDEKNKGYIKNLSKSQFVIDLQNIFNPSDTPADYETL